MAVMVATATVLFCEAIESPSTKPCPISLMAASIFYLGTVITQTKRSGTISSPRFPELSRSVAHDNPLAAQAIPNPASKVSINQSRQGMPEKSGLKL